VGLLSQEQHTLLFLKISVSQKNSFRKRFCSLTPILCFHFFIAITMTEHTIMEKEAGQHDVKVVHNYHDYANKAEGEAESVDDQQYREELTRSMNRSCGDQNFPVKLHYMLSEMEADGMDDIVSWQPHGRCFLVHKQQDFVDKVLHL
jgi:hypothetical protein